MSTPWVEGFHVDEENEEKFWTHGLTVDQVMEVLEQMYTIRRNRKARRATHLIVGRDRQGRCVAIPIEATLDPAIWRPITAWYCKPSEVGWLP